MAKGDGKRIRGIQMFRLEVHVQRLAEHHAHLLLGRGSVAGDRLLGLPGSIFMNISDSIFKSGEHRGPLRAPQFQDDLRVLAVERRLQRHFGAVVGLADFGDGVVDLTEF